MDGGKFYFEQHEGRKVDASKSMAYFSKNFVSVILSFFWFCRGGQGRGNNIVMYLFMGGCEDTKRDINFF